MCLKATPCETHTSSMVPRKNPSLREEEGNRFSMSGGGCVPEKTSDKEGRSDFPGGPARLQSLPSMPASGQRVLRPLVSAWQSAPARRGREPWAVRRRDPLWKSSGQMPFLVCSGSGSRNSLCFSQFWNLNSDSDVERGGFCSCVHGGRPDNACSAKKQNPAF